MGPYLRPEVSVNTHNPLSLTASYEAASHANAVTSCPPPLQKTWAPVHQGNPRPNGGGGQSGFHEPSQHRTHTMHDREA